ncbi:MAG TPA: hypothetical protein VEB22_11905, partial [Phycisphaerales bacterium]|nr:hypothetical protein [Phycisphaerales bacterium]
MKTTIGRNPRSILAVPLPVCLLTVATGGLVGCADPFSDIDRSTDDAIRERSASLLGATVRPELSGRPLDGPIGADQVSRTNPPTSDPAARQFKLTPADEARDVAARLAAYGKIAEGATPLDLTTSLRQAQSTSREYLR